MYRTGTGDDLAFYDAIEGYCGQLSYRPGDIAMLHVSTHARSYDVVIERWGASLDIVFEATGLAGAYHPPPVDADAVGCDWPVALEVPIVESMQSGFYLVTLRADGVEESVAVAHAGFVVRTPAPASPMLMVLATNTWNAYNTWGGASLYTGGKQVSFARPFARGMLCRPEVERDDRKARPVRWGEDPDADGAIFQAYRTEHGYPSAIGSTGWFTHERRFVEWAEAADYQFDYAISADVDADPSLLDGYDVVLGIGHDEYWSAPQRRAIETHVRGGGDFVSISGNTMFWQVRLEGSTMVCHKYSAHETDPVVAAGQPELMTGLWCDPLVNEPEWTVLGAGSAFGLYHRFGQATPIGIGGFLIYRSDHWMLEGTGLRYGDVLGAKHGVVGYETVGCRIGFDDLQLPVAVAVEGMPSDVEIVACTPSSSLGVGEYPASIAALSDQGDLEFMAERYFGGLDDGSIAKARHGNAVMLTCRPFGAGGGEVITIGTTDWTFGLADDPAIAQVTANILNRLSLPGSRPARRA